MADDVHAMADDGRRSVRRRTLLLGVDPGTPFYQLMIGCAAEGSHAYKLRHESGLVDVTQAADVLRILRDFLPEGCTNLPDSAMENISSICNEAATSGGVREWQERLRRWEQEKAAIVGEGDNRTRIHMYASTVSAALTSASVSHHGHRVVNEKSVVTFAFDDEEFKMTKRTLSSLSWMGAISGRYTFLGAPKSFIDPAFRRYLHRENKAKPLISKRGAIPAGSANNDARTSSSKKSSGESNKRWLSCSRARNTRVALTRRNRRK